MANHGFFHFVVRAAARDPHGACLWAALLALIPLGAWADWRNRNKPLRSDQIRNGWIDHNQLLFAALSLVGAVVACCVLGEIFNATHPDPQYDGPWNY